MNESTFYELTKYPGVKFVLSDDFKAAQSREAALLEDKRLLLDLVRQMEQGLIEYGQHLSDCLLHYWEGGEPTADGGYREKFKGVWYRTKPVDETPKCDCGLHKLLSESARVLEGK